MSLEGSYNGLSFGPGTDYHVGGMDGFFDLPELRTNDFPRSTGLGTFVGTDRPTGRTVVLTLHLIAANPTAFQSLVDALVTATDVQTADKPLRFLGNTRYVKARPRRRSIPIETGYVQTRTTAVVEFFCADPTVYFGAP